MFDLCCYWYFKLKIGVGEVDVDVVYVIVIKCVFGECVSVWVDVNQVWDEGVVQCVCVMFGDNGIVLIEQFIVCYNCVGLVCLSSCGGVLIMVDEVIESVEDVFYLVCEGVVLVFVLKIVKNGGLCVVLCSVVIVEVVGIGLYGGIMFEGGIGILVVVYVFVIFDCLVWYSELFGLLLLIEDIFFELLCYQDFYLYVLCVLGFGLVFDEECLVCFCWC